MVRIKYKIKSKVNAAEIRRNTQRASNAWLNELGAVIITFADRSMRRAPKNPPADAGKYGRQVSTTFKSGKKKGKPRTFFQKGKYSRPGSPPFKRTRGLNLGSYQGFDVQGHTRLIAGPKHFPSYGNKQMSAPVPHIQEFGGSYTRKFTLPAKAAGAFVTKTPGKNGQPGRTYRSPRLPAKKIVETVKYPPRPYMVPAAVKGRAWFLRNGARIAKKVMR